MARPTPSTRWRTWIRPSGRLSTRAFSILVSQLQARKGHDVYERLPRISCPTLVASGRSDGIAPAANGAAIASQIPHAELRLFDGGHLFFLQDPTALPEIIAFLRAD